MIDYLFKLVPRDVASGAANYVSEDRRRLLARVLPEYVRVCTVSGRDEALEHARRIALARWAGMSVDGRAVLHDDVEVGGVCIYRTDAVEAAW